MDTGKDGAKGEELTMANRGIFLYVDSILIIIVSRLVCIVFVITNLSKIGVAISSSATCILSLDIFTKNQNSRTNSHFHINLYNEYINNHRLFGRLIYYKFESMYRLGFK